MGAEHLLLLPPGSRLERIGEEAEAALCVDRPHDVRRGVDQEPIPLLGCGQLLVELGVGDGDRRLVGEQLQELRVVLVEGADPRRLYGDRPDQPIGADQRGGHHRMDALLPNPQIALVVRECTVGEVVAGPSHAPVRGGPAGDP